MSSPVQLAVSAFAAVQLASAPSPGGDAKLRHELEALRSRRVLFGHQSVGANVLDGLQRLANEAGVTIRIVETRSAAEVPAGAFGHVRVAENGNPSMKLESFSRAFDGSGARAPDIAFVKFCYVDVGPGTDVAALFARYRATLKDLAARHPATTFVHVTVPLTSVQAGTKAFAKQLLGRAPTGWAENARRDDFNGMLREAYQGKEPIFDLARVEAMHPDGAIETATFEQRSVPALVPAFTTDGGHLNAEGQLRAARELVSVLAAIPAGRPAAR
jgi:hypothetical protein